MNNDNKKDNLFKVNIEDDGFLNPEDLDNIAPPPITPPRKKFEVHIEEDDSVASFVEDANPKYNGEIYFANHKPSKPAPASNVQRRPASGSRKKKSRAASSLVAVFCIVVLIFSTALSAFAISCINDILAFGRSEEKIQINIPNGATTDEIIDILAENDLIKQKTFCKIFYEGFTYIKNINKKKKPADPVYFGDIYYVEKNLGLEGYLTEFREEAKTAETVSLVFPEGWTIYQIFDKIDEYGVCSKSELIASVSNASSFDYDFLKEIPDNSFRTFKLEGYLYPDTYEFYEESNANSVIRKLLDGSKNKWTDEYEEQRIKLGLTRDEVINIASIIQREAANAEQMPLISSVIHNRLNHAVSWPLLGCDSTANYVKKYVSPNVSPAQALTYQQYYDTYISQGLPPGPICNPGDDAIKAALFPDDTDYFYFRHDKYGEIYMAKTQAEHDRNGNEVLRVNNR